MNKVRKQDTVVNEENRDVDTNDIIVAFIGIESRREPMDITGGVGTTALANNGRETNESRSDFAGRREEGGSSDVRPVGIAGKATISSGTTSMDNTLRNLFIFVTSESDDKSHTISGQETRILHVRGRSAAASVAG